MEHGKSAVNWCDNIFKFTVTRSASHSGQLLSVLFRPRPRFVSTATTESVARRQRPPWPQLGKHLEAYSIPFYRILTVGSVTSGRRRFISSTQPYNFERPIWLHHSSSVELQSPD